jgi:quinolinate synthase
LSEEKVLFVPDRHLAHWVARHVPEKTIIPYGGFCPIHHSITPEAVADEKRHHPQAVVMAHPECPAEVLELADVVLSTGGMLRYARESDAHEFIVVTEHGIVHPLAKESPEKVFHGLPAALCANMKTTTLESVKRALEENITQIEIAPDVAEGARRAVQRMVEIG